MIALEYIRRENNMSSVELAERLGVSNVFVSLIESGKKKLPNKYLSALSNIFGLDENVFQKEMPKFREINDGK